MRQLRTRGRSGPAAPRRQCGMTMVGLLCILALVGTIGYAVLRLVPVYLNYLKVARSLDVTAAEFKGENPDQGGIRRSLDKHWQIEDISAVEAKEVEIIKDDNGLSLHVAYDDSVPYISNVSLAVHFDKTVKVR